MHTYLPFKAGTQFSDPRLIKHELCVQVHACVCVCVCMYLAVAHDNKVEERIEDYRKISSTLDLPKLVSRQYKSDGKWFSFCDHK